MAAERSLATHSEGRQKVVPQWVVCRAAQAMQAKQSRAAFDHGEAGQGMQCAGQAARSPQQVRPTTGYQGRQTMERGRALRAPAGQHSAWTPSAGQRPTWRRTEG